MPDPDAQTALISAGRYLRMLLADSDEALRIARREASRHERRSSELQDRLDEISAALAKDGIALPPLSVVKAA